MLLPFLHIRNILMRSINPNREYFSCILRKNEEGSDKLVSHFISINLTGSAVNVFSTQGFQTHRFHFADLTKKFGKPKAVSQNGQFFLFGKKKTLSLFVCLLTNTGMIPFKEIDLEGDFKDYLSEVAKNVG